MRVRPRNGLRMTSVWKRFIAGCRLFSPSRADGGGFFYLVLTASMRLVCIYEIQAAAAECAYLVEAGRSKSIRRMSRGRACR